jgi:hypothetical protein
MPSKTPAVFLAAQYPPEENPAQPHSILLDYKIVGVEALSGGQPDRGAHEQAGIWQPVLEEGYPLGGLRPSFHASPLADGTMPFDRRRMGMFIDRNLIAMAAAPGGAHKSLASAANQQDFLDTVTAFLERLAAAGRIHSYLDPLGSWDGNVREFTVDVTAYETGSMDVITIRRTFGPAPVAGA